VVAFIVRPFGTKAGIDFDRVDAELLKPALSTLGIGRMASDSMAAGVELHHGLLEALLTADLVVVDVTAPDAGVFYELGLAHALRDRRTVLIAAGPDGPVPLDLCAVQRFIYDPANPSLGIQPFVERLRAALASDRQDSPVYLFLPGLQPPRTAAVPEGFVSETRTARTVGDPGHLRLLGQEARSFHWAANGLKEVGEAQILSGDMTGARETLEYLLSLTPLDPDVNLRLGTVYQRLKESRASDTAIKRALDSLEPGSSARAEAYALLGRNAKGAWVENWRDSPESDRRAEALRCTSLKTAYDCYLKAFKQDLNSYYGGLNALALGTITIELADALPDVWSELFEDDAEAPLRLAALRKEVSSLVAGVALSLEAAGHRRSQGDVWVDISKADFELLTASRPGRVAEKYRRAISGAPPFVADSVLRQIHIYRDLEILTDNANAAIAALEPGSTPGKSPAVPAEKKKALLFVGHGIDAHGRSAPRFPASEEPRAREAILRAVEEETRGAAALFAGVAGASSGGDILFHEACEVAGIASRICLAVPPPEYARLAVSEAGSQWESRFRDLIARHPYRVLSETADVPAWLRPNAPYDFWRRDTMWRYHTAAAIGEITVIALWDGQAGAAADMVRTAKERGAKVVVLDALGLFASP
jgi:hypothetical protein